VVSAAGSVGAFIFPLNSMQHVSGGDFFSMVGDVGLRAEPLVRGSRGRSPLNLKRN